MSLFTQQISGKNNILLCVRRVILIVTFYFWVIIPIVAMFVWLIKGHHASEAIRQSLTFLEPTDPLFLDNAPSGFYDTLKYYGDPCIELLAFSTSVFVSWRLSRCSKRLFIYSIYILILGAVWMAAAIVRENVGGAILPFAAAVSGIVVGDFYKRQPRSQQIVTFC
jgi:hypothetical protein